MLVFFLGVSCTSNHKAIKTQGTGYVSIDLDSIRKRGKLIAVTDFNSTNYFIYKGEPMGFNYEMLKSFSDHIGVDVEIITNSNPSNACSLLKNGEADLVAMGLDTGSFSGNEVLLTEPVDETRLVLVQRKSGGHSGKDINSRMVRNTHELAGRTVYVQGGTAESRRLGSLQKETGDSITIVEVPYQPEQLIEHVANAEIDFTVCEENVAQVNSTYYPGIDVLTVISNPVNLAWGVRKNNSDALIRELNRWLAAYKQTDSYSFLHAKYFKNQRSNIIVKSDYYAISTGKVSQYDDIIRQYSALIKWDWRLLASLIFQESRFQANVISTAGAYGLMQIMPVTGKNFGVDITLSPENNLKAGILYITWLHSIFDSKIPDTKERMCFILAAYNAGPGHVLDAMKLAEKNGMDPLKWDGSVALWLTRKSDPRYYKDKVVKNGYFRGNESVAFVSQVMARFEHYKNIVPAGKMK